MAVLITLSAPTEFENFKALSEISVTNISSAPALLADKTQSVPIGPEPVINTFFPKIFPACFKYENLRKSQAGGSGGFRNAFLIVSNQKL